MYQLNTATVQESALSKFPLSALSIFNTPDGRERKIRSYFDQLKKGLPDDFLSLTNNEEKSAATDTAAVPVSDPVVAPIPDIVYDNPKTITTFSPLQEWEGYVTEIRSDTFLADLIDKTAGKSLPEESIEFATADLSDDDSALLKVGAIFRWSIGYQKQNGTKRKVSQIVFRRLPAFSKIDMKAAKSRINRIIEGLTWT